MDQLLQKIKTGLRIKHDKLDEEIMATIEAALIDLKLGGIHKLDVDDALIYRAIQLYCKASYGMAGEASDKYQASYDMLKISLALAGDYNGHAQ